MATHYPPGMDGATVMRNTATALQATLRGLLASDLTALDGEPGKKPCPDCQDPQENQA